MTQLKSKGASGNLGGKSLCQLAASIENDCKQGNTAKLGESWPLLQRQFDLLKEEIQKSTV